MAGNAVGGLVGLGIATAGMASGIFSENVLQGGISLTGTALMAWYIVQLHKELRMERKERREERAENLQRYYDVVDTMRDQSIELTNAVNKEAVEHVSGDYSKTMPPEKGRYQ